MADKHGSVLILSLWALFFLAALAVAVGAHVSAGLSTAGRLRERTATYYLARAGVERALSEVDAEGSNEWDGVAQDSWTTSEDTFKNTPLGAGMFSVTYTWCRASGETVTNYGVVGEERLININRADDALLAALLQSVGKLGPQSALDTAAAIVKGRKLEREALTDPRERDYYGDQSEADRRETGGYRSIHELLLVEGVDDALFGRIRPCVTVHGSGKLNINSAGVQVLTCVGLARGGGAATSDALASKIARFRDAENVFANPSGPAIIQTLEDYAGLQPGEKALLSAMMRSLTLRSSCFTGLAEGRMEGIKGGARRIEFTYDREQGAKVYWHED